MKHIKKILTLPLLILLILCLTGCRLTAEKLEERMTKATEENPPTLITVDMELDLVIEEDGTPKNSPAHLYLGATLSPDNPNSVYLEMTVSFGEQNLESIRFYPATSDHAAYLYSSSTDMWVQTEPSQLENADIPVPGASPDAPDLGEATLEPNAATMDGKTLHALVYQFSGEQLRPYLNLIPDDTAGLPIGDNAAIATLSPEELDLSKLNVVGKVYAEKETYLLRYIEMRISGMDGMMADIIGKTLGQDAQTALSVEIRDLTADIYLGYGPQELPPLPEEAPIKAAQAIFNPDMGDGTYVLQEMGAAVHITCPKDWTASVSSYAEMKILRNDGRKLVQFNALTGTDSDLIRTYLMQDVLSSLKAQGDTCTDGSDGPLNGYETYWIRQSNGLMRCFAWKPIGPQTYLFIEIADATANYRSHSILSPVLELIVDYQL